jgi:hypothetical protein
MSEWVHKQGDRPYKAKGVKVISNEITFDVRVYKDMTKYEKMKKSELFDELRSALTQLDLRDERIKAQERELTKIKDRSEDLEAMADKTADGFRALAAVILGEDSF